MVLCPWYHSSSTVVKTGCTTVRDEHVLTILVFEHFSLWHKDLLVYLLPSDSVMVQLKSRFTLESWQTEIGNRSRCIRGMCHVFWNFPSQTSHPNTTSEKEQLCNFLAQSSKKLRIPCLAHGNVVSMHVNTHSLYHLRGSHFFPVSVLPLSLVACQQSFWRKTPKDCLVVKNFFTVELWQVTPKAETWPLVAFKDDC